MATPDLSRLLRPESIAVFGGGWARNVVEQCLRSNYRGNIWPVHPHADDMHGIPCVKSIEQLPGVPDIAFIGINREASIEVVAQLRAMGCGGVICFASGFGEAQAEDSRGLELERELVHAADTMPLIGPNCYGLLNYADGAMLWPDQHGGAACESGVALLTQSSNIAINLTMQQRGLPIVYAMTAGNQLQLSLGQLGQALLTDDRVTALGMYVESVGNIRDFEAMARLAQSLGKSVVAIKAGRSDTARKAMLSHTNSLAGDDAASDAFFKRLGIVRLDSLAVMLETLKLLHICGPLKGNRLQSMSCSGGEAALMADSAQHLPLEYPALQSAQSAALRKALGPQVALANPLDYHTYIWDDFQAMQATFAAMMQGDADMTALVIDFPRQDRCSGDSWYAAVDALAAAAKAANRPTAVLASLSENVSESDAEQIMHKGLIPLAGMEQGLAAIAAGATAGQLADVQPQPLALPERTEHSPDGAAASRQIRSLTEAEAKQLLIDALTDSDAARFLHIPSHRTVAVGSETSEQLADLPGICKGLCYPVVLKIQSINQEVVQHKSDIGGVVLDIEDEHALQQAFVAMHQRLAGDLYLIEEQAPAAVAELLVSITRDDVYGLMLTLAAGGIYTELMRDSQHLLLPAAQQDVKAAINSLGISRLLEGYRGGASVPLDMLIESVEALQNFALTYKDQLLELEINPLLCNSNRLTAADLILRFD